MLLLVTGGCGFIGTNFIRYMLGRDTKTVIVNLDKVTYAGNPANLADAEEVFGQGRYEFLHGDVCDSSLVRNLLTSRAFDAVIHFAAESHVDRSIADATPFIQTNVLGTQTLLDAARLAKVPRYLQISTDEVYGSLGPKGFFSETTPISPNSPYSASKASADMLVQAAHHTYGMNTVITRCSNNYGPYQFPEKLIPLMIRQALHDESLPVYGDGLQIRDWIYVEDHCRGIEVALTKGQAGAVYNFGGGAERTNLEIVRLILTLLKKPESLIRHVQDRPGHDRRYAMNYSLAAKELGYSPKWSFEKGISATLSWYLENRSWVNSVESGAYREFLHKWYGERL